MIVALVGGILLVPLWAYAPSTALLVLGAFLMQFMVQGAWGVIPAHLSELSPDSVRGFLPGFAYQCGVLVASSVVYIEAVFAKQLSYATAMALTAVTVLVLAAVVTAWVRNAKARLSARRLRLAVSRAKRREECGARFSVPRRQSLPTPGAFEEDCEQPARWQPVARRATRACTGHVFRSEESCSGPYGPVPVAGRSVHGHREICASQVGGQQASRAPDRPPPVRAAENHSAEPRLTQIGMAQRARSKYDPGEISAAQILRRSNPRARNRTPSGRRC